MYILKYLFQLQLNYITKATKKLALICWNEFMREVESLLVGTTVTLTTYSDAGVLQEVGCVATNWDMYDTFNAQETNQEGMSHNSWIVKS